MPMATMARPTFTATARSIRQVARRCNWRCRLMVGQRQPPVGRIWLARPWATPAMQRWAVLRATRLTTIGRRSGMPTTVQALLVCRMCLACLRVGYPIIIRLPRRDRPDTFCSTICFPVLVVQASGSALAIRQLTTSPCNSSPPTPAPLASASTRSSTTPAPSPARSPAAPRRMPPHSP